MFNVWTAERPSLKEEHYPEEKLYIFTILASLVFVFIFSNRRHVPEEKKTKQNKTTLLVQHVNLCVEKMDDGGIFIAQVLWFGPGYC